MPDHSNNSTPSQIPHTYSSFTQTFPTGNWNELYDTVELVARALVPVPSKCPVEFEFTMDAVTHNSSLLEEAGYDLGKFIDQHPGSTISYGSKLHPLDQLEPSYNITQPTSTSK